MSETLTYSAEGVVQLVIETVAADALVRGLAGATDIEITCQRHGPDTPEFVPMGDGVRFTGGFAERLIVPDTLHIAAEAALGDLRVQQLAGEVSLGDVRGDLRLDQLSGPVLLRHAAADIRADDVAELHIEGGCSGDVRFAGGDLVAETIAGDLRIVEAGNLRLNNVHGDLALERASGSVEIRQVSGDARLADVGGPVTLGGVFGDLRSSELVGGLLATQVNGDAFLEGPFAASAEYQVTANGDIQLALPANADLRLTVRAAGRIRSDVPLTPVANGTPTFTATVGEGASHLNLTSRGDLRITQAGASGKGWQGQGGGFGVAEGDPFAELHNLGERIRQQVSASLAAAGINVETGEMNWGRGERGRGYRGPRSVPPEPPVPPVPPARPPTASRPAAPERPRPETGESASATAAERLAILKMVQEGQITAEEADLLLRALGK